METKKQPKKRPGLRRGPLAMEPRVDLGVRMIPAHAEEVTRAAELDAERRGVRYSRNDFCVAALLAAARSVLKGDGANV